MSGERSSLRQAPNPGDQLLRAVSSSQDGCSGTCPPRPCYSGHAGWLVRLGTRSILVMLNLQRYRRCGGGTHKNKQNGHIEQQTKRYVETPHSGEKAMFDRQNKHNGITANLHSLGKPITRPNRRSQITTNPQSPNAQLRSRFRCVFACKNRARAAPVGGSPTWIAEPRPKYHRLLDLIQSLR